MDNAFGNRRGRITYCIIILILVFFGVFSYGVADYSNYELIYDYYTLNANANGVVDAGFFVLCKLCKSIGISFPVFRGLYILVTIVILVKGVARYDKNSNAPLLLYIIFPFALDIAQFRFFMASAIIIFSIRFLEEKKLGKYIIAVLIAMTQQVSAIIYLVLLLIAVEKKKMYWIVFSASIVEMVVLLAFNEIIFGRITQNLTHYLNYTSSSYSIKLCFMYLAMNGVIVLYDFFFTKNKDKTDDMMMNILCSLFVLIPFIIMNENFTRLYRGLIVLVYCRLFRRTNREWTFDLRGIVAFVFCGIMFYIHLSPRNLPHWERIVVPLFENNYILDWLRSL